MGRTCRGKAEGGEGSEKASRFMMKGAGVGQGGGQDSLLASKVCDFWGEVATGVHRAD